MKNNSAKSGADNTHDLRAKLLPFEGDSEIKIYVVTGLHGGIKIPESFCEECNLFVKAARESVQEVDRDVNIDVISYWTRFLYPLLKGGHHPPVMLINGEVVAQGYDVPDKELIKGKLEETANYVD